MSATEGDTKWEELNTSGYLMIRFLDNHKIPDYTAKFFWINSSHESRGEGSNNNK